MSERSTTAELVVIVEDVVSMMIQFTPNREIIQIVSERYGKSRSQCYAYLKKALDVFKEMSLDNLDGERNKQKDFLLDRIRDNLTLARASENEQNRVKFENMAATWYDKYLRLFPDNLSPKTEESERSISITFNGLPPKQVSEFYEARGSEDSYEYRGFKVIKNKSGKFEITDPNGHVKITGVNPKEWIDSKLK